MDFVSHRGGAVARTWCGRGWWVADLNFAEFIFPKMFKGVEGVVVWGEDCGGHVVILGLGERGVLGMELSSFMYPRAYAHNARTCTRAPGKTFEVVLFLF
jgi:hypothetical protein